MHRPMIVRPLFGGTRLILRSVQKANAWSNRHWDALISWIESFPAGRGFLGVCRPVFHWLLVVVGWVQSALLELFALLMCVVGLAMLHTPDSLFAACVGALVCLAATVIAQSPAAPPRSMFRRTIGLAWLTLRPVAALLSIGLLGLAALTYVLPETALVVLVRTAGALNETLERGESALGWLVVGVLFLVLLAAASTKKWTAFTPVVALSERLRSGVHTVALLVSLAALITLTGAPAVHASGLERLTALRVDRETAASEARYLAVVQASDKSASSAAPPSDDRFFDILGIAFQVQLAETKPFHEAAQTAAQQARTLDPQTVAEVLKHPQRLISEVGQRAIARFKRDAASAPHLWQRIHDRWEQTPTGTDGAAELRAAILAQAISIVLDKSVTLDATLSGKIGGDTIDGIGEKTAETVIDRALEVDEATLAGSVEPAAKPAISLADAVSPTDGRELGYVVATVETAPAGAVIGSGDALRVLEKPLSSTTIAKVADPLHPVVESAPHDLVVSGPAEVESRRSRIPVIDDVHVPP